MTDFQISEETYQSIARNRGRDHSEIADFYANVPLSEPWKIAGEPLSEKEEAEDKLVAHGKMLGERYKLIAEQRKSIEAREKLLTEGKIIADVRLFAEVHELQLVVHPHAAASDKFRASFEHCLVHRDGFLRAECGIGTSESDAVRRYGERISSSWLSRALSDGTRRDILTWKFHPAEV